MSTEDLSPEKKVNLSISMTDVCVRICADGVKNRDRAIRKEELIEKVRERIAYRKRRHPEV